MAGEQTLRALTQAMRLHKDGALDQAAEAYKAVITGEPNQPDARWLYAQLCLHQKNIGEAIAQLITLLRLAPDHAQALPQLLALCDQPATQEAALAYLSAALAEQPDSVSELSLICRIYEQRKSYRAGLPYMDRLYRAGDAREGFLVHYIRALAIGERVEEALTVANRAITRFATHAPLYAMRAEVLQMLGRWEDALADYHSAAKLDPQKVDYPFELGHLEMMVSGMKHGMDGYRLRFAATHIPLPQLSLPRWQGEALNGKHLLLLAEQGLGDAVMFMSMIPWLEQQCAKLTIATFPRLLALTQRSFPQAQVIPLTTELSVQADFQAPMGDLMEFVLPHYTPSKHPPFLQADAPRAKALREQYLNLGKKTLIGISWHTSNDESSYMRNIPLDQLARLFEKPDTQCISLQYGNHAADIARFPKLHADPAIDPVNDVDALCAQIAAMDRVITIQNATAHLAGALGVPCTLLLSAASNWRWGIGEGNVWYESVEIVRQKKIYDWQIVMRSLTAALA